MKSHPSNRTGRRRAAWHILPAVGMALLLASCGGSDDGSPTPVTAVDANQPPASASASSDGFIAFLKTIVGTTPETTLPLDVTTFVAPTTETALPDPAI